MLSMFFYLSSAARDGVPHQFNVLHVHQDPFHENQKAGILNLLQQMGKRHACPIGLSAPVRDEEIVSV